MKLYHISQYKHKRNSGQEIDSGVDVQNKIVLTHDTTFQQGPRLVSRMGLQECRKKYK